MNSRIFEAKKIDRVFDLCVAGGGLAGTMAAVAAAREGLSVILLERFGCLGGMATSGLIFPFMRDMERVSNRRANAGLYLRLLRDVYALGGSEGPESKRYREEYMKLALDRMVRAYPGIKVLFNARLCETERDGDRIRSVTAATESGNLVIRARMFADCTGNADLTAFAGLPYEQGRASDGLPQPVTTCFRFGGVDKARFDRNEANRIYCALKAEGKIRNQREDVLVFDYPVPGILHMNTTRVSGIDPCDAEAMTEAEFELREQEYEMYRIMRQYVPGMEHCELIGSSVLAGVRESRRIVGRARIETEDVLNARKFEDSIARGAYNVDIHNPSGAGTVHMAIPDGDYYTIPYGAILPAGMKNLIVPGRAVSSSHEALSAVRVMPITTCMGEAAGIAAAEAAKADFDFTAADVSAIRAEIVARGGLV